MTGCLENSVKQSAGGGDSGDQEGGGDKKRKYDGWVATSYGYVKERQEVEQKVDVKKDDTEVMSARCNAIPLIMLLSSSMASKMFDVMSSFYHV